MFSYFYFYFIRKIGTHGKILTALIETPDLFSFSDAGGTEARGSPASPPLLSASLNSLLSLCFLVCFFVSFCLNFV